LDKRGFNRVRWERLDEGCLLLLYCEHGGVRGVWMLCRLVEKFESYEPVRYWVENPTGFPLQIRVKFLLPRELEPTSKNPEKEYGLEGKRVDVVWRKTPRSYPYIVFEVSLRGNLYEDLVKLKHAYDIWNAIPVLITTEERAEEARRWIHGTFHEVENIFRIITVDKVKRYYELKRKIKELESDLGIF